MAPLKDTLRAAEHSISIQTEIIALKNGTIASQEATIASQEVEISSLKEVIARQEAEMQELQCKLRTAVDAGAQAASDLAQIVVEINRR